MVRKGSDGKKRCEAVGREGKKWRNVSGEEGDTARGDERREMRAERRWKMGREGLERGVQRRGVRSELDQARR